MEDKIRGAIYGLLVGDALGVSYEFISPDNLPHLDRIEMQPPEKFAKTYPEVPIGTWSDDGAQALCLLSSLLFKQTFSQIDFTNRLCNWLFYGYMAIDHKVFDVGIQTRDALLRYKQGFQIEDMANRDEFSNGNGALMRVLPLALWHQGTDLQLIDDAYAQSHITHAHIRSKICCAFYCLWARYLLKNIEVNAAWVCAQETLNMVFQDKPEEKKELKYIFQSHKPMGTGYVVDCLHSAFFALQQTSFKDVIKTAVALGHDTDTTACVAGGLAGIIFGYNSIPEDWLNQLRGKEIVEPLIESLSLHRK